MADPQSRYSALEKPKEYCFNSVYLLLNVFPINYTTMNLTGLLRNLNFKLKETVWSLLKDSNVIQKLSDYTNLFHSLDFHYLTVYI